MATAAGDEAEGGFDAINNHSYTRSDAFGSSGQISRGTPLAGRDNHFVVGAGLDSAATRFDFSAEWAHLTRRPRHDRQRPVRRG